jgi:hypothetical protein
MKTAFTIALTIGTTNAITRLRAKESVAAKIDHKDNMFIEALASKYNCREAGATLDETIAKVKVKNAAETTALGNECEKRRINYNSPWAAAQQKFATEQAKIVPEETKTYDEKVAASAKVLQDIKTKLAAAVAKASSIVEKAQADFTSKDTIYQTKRGEHAGAVKSAAEEEKQFAEVTKPNGLKKNDDVFNAAKTLYDGELANAVNKATAARTSSIAVCEEVTAKRKKHIDGDSALLTSEIAPLVKQLSALKCVDSYDSQRAAAGLSLLEVENKAACALTSSKVSAFIEASNYLGGLPLDSQFKIFTDRIAEENTHMNNVHNKCILDATNIFKKEKLAAEKDHAAKLAKSLEIKTKSDQKLDEEFNKLVVLNRNIVGMKAHNCVMPLAEKDAASDFLIKSKTELSSAQNTQKSEEDLASKQYAAAVESALNTKNTNTASRQKSVEDSKQSAFKVFEVDKKFVEEYCASAARDLKKEKDILDKIDAKMKGLLVTNTAVVGATSTDTALTKAQLDKIAEDEEAAYQESLRLKREEQGTKETERKAEEAEKTAATEQDKKADIALKKRAEEDSKAKAKAEEEAHKKQLALIAIRDAEEGKKKTEEEGAKKKEEEGEKRKKEEGEKKLAEAEKKQSAEEAEKKVAAAAAEKAAEEIAKKAAEEQAKADAEQKAKAVAEQATKLAAEQAGKKAEEEGAKKAAEEGAKKAAEEKAKADAEEKAKAVAEAATKKAAEEGAKKAAEEAAKKAAEAELKKVAEEEDKAKKAAEQGEKHAAEQQAKHVSRLKIIEENQKREAAIAAAKAEQKEKHDARVRAEQKDKEKARLNEQNEKRAAEQHSKRKAEEHAKHVARVNEQNQKRAAEARQKQAAEQHQKHVARVNEQNAKTAAEQQSKRKAEEHSKHVARVNEQNQKRAAEQNQKHAAEQHQKHVARVSEQNQKTAAEQHVKHSSRRRSRRRVFSRRRRRRL